MGAMRMETEIDRLRRDIKIHGKTFLASDFKMHPHVHANLNKMVRLGEVVVIGEMEKFSGGRRPKIYAPTGIPAQIKRQAFRIHPKVAPWAAIYPDLFTLPDFTGYQMIVRRHVIPIF